MKKIKNLKKYLLIFIVLIIILLLTSCANVINIDKCINPINIYGFWGGLWHGIILPFSFIGSLFSDNITIYAVNNNGVWYNLGFILGTYSIVYGIVKKS